MNWNKIRRKTDLIKSPSISSNSSGFSSSNLSTVSVVSAECHQPPPSQQQQLYGHTQCQNHHNHVQQHQIVTNECPMPPPPTNGHHHPAATNGHYGSTDAEYGTMSTIKRKPNLNPVIPLTSTTRNMARQSDDALIEINEDQQPPHLSGQLNGHKPGVENRNVQYGTLRRSNTDDRISINHIIYDPSRALVEREQLPLKHAHSSTSSSGVYSIGNGDRSSPSHSSARSVGCSSICTTNESDEDDLIDDLDNLPPPPDSLKLSLSTVSLASLPPPPPEFLDSEYSPDDSDCLSSSTPKAMSPTVDIAPSSRYNSFDRTLTRKHVNGGGSNCGKPAANSHFGTGPRQAHQHRPSLKGAGLRGGCTTGATDTPRSLSPTHSMTECDCSPTSDLPPPLPSLHAINALHSIHQDTKYRPMYSSSSSCDSSTHDDYTSSCATDTTISRQSPDRLDVLEQLEANHSSNHRAPPHAIVAPTVISAQHRQAPLADNEPVKPALINAFANNNCNYKPAHNGHTQLQQQQQQPPPQNGHTQQVQQPQQQHQQPANAINSQTYVKEKRVTIAASYNDPPPDRSPCKGPLPQAPDEFLKDLIKVMDRKWKVALALSCDQAPAGQVMGFREPHPLDTLLPTPTHQPQQTHHHSGPTVAPGSVPPMPPAHADQRKPMFAAVRPSIKQQPDSHVLPGPVSSFAPQFKAMAPPQPQGQQPLQQRPNLYQSSFQQQSFQLQHRLQQGQNAGPLPVPVPFHRKSKAPPPAPPKRSDQTRLSRMKIIN